MINENFKYKSLKKLIPTVNNFNSLVLLNKGSEFEPINLPLISQISPIRDIQTLDYNNDSMIDILLVGFYFVTSIKKEDHLLNLGFVIFSKRKYFGNFKTKYIHFDD